MVCKCQCYASADHCCSGMDVMLPVVVPIVCADAVPSVCSPLYVLLIVLCQWIKSMLLLPILDAAIHGNYSYICRTYLACS